MAGGTTLSKSISWITLLQPLFLLLEELNARKQENLQMESIKESNNDLLEYLRSLDSDMVIT